MSADASDRTDEVGDKQQLETSEIGEKAGGGLGEEKRQKSSCVTDVTAIKLIIISSITVQLQDGLVPRLHPLRCILANEE